jgi:spore maturation protein SpmB
MENKEIVAVKPSVVEKATFQGSVVFTLRDENGNVKQEQKVDNIIVKGGLAHIANRMNKDANTTGGTNPVGGVAVMNWMELGTGTTAATVDDTLLETYIADSRTGTTASIVTTTQTNDTVQHACVFGAGVGTGAVTEAGIFNVATQNTATMLNRVVFAVINKGALDSLTATWQIKVA